MKTAKQLRAEHVGEGEFIPAQVSDDRLSAELKAERDELKACLNGIAFVLGNVNHAVGHGENAARMRGQMLNDIRDMIVAVLAKAQPGQKPHP